MSTLLRIAATVGALVACVTVHASGQDEHVDALSPSLAACAGNSSFCGAVLRVDSAAGTIRSVAAGAHYGPVWGIPHSGNDATGVGWCVDDTHTGFPVGPIKELPVPDSWSDHDNRRASTVMTLFGGDVVAPYQPLRVDASGELAEFGHPDVTTTRHRQIAVWFALRSLLPDSAGTPRVDLASATAFADAGALVPSPVGNSAIELARRMVAVADAMTATGAPIVTISPADGSAPTSPGEPELFRVRVTDGEGRPLPNHPVWPSASSNATVTATNTDPASSAVAFRNASDAGWPSLDMTQTRQEAALTDDDGDAMFTVEVDAPGTWHVGFDTETSPALVHLFGDDINAQNNVTVLDGDIVRSSGALDGEIDQRYVRAVKTSGDPTFGVAGAVLALIDANGDEVARGTTGADGIVDFPPVNVARPTPWRVRELTAPVGLAPLNADVEVVAEDELSSDASQPTVVEIDNAPIVHELVVQKVIEGSAGFGPDLSGFTFSITRDLDGQHFGEVTTDQSGRSSPAIVPAGAYSIEEVGRPDRWPGDAELSAPIRVTIPLDSTAPITVTFENALAPPTISTAASDRSDGDKYLSAHGGAVEDAVEICGAVEDTAYIVTGELAFVAAGEDVGEPTGIVATSEFVSIPGDDGCQSIELVFDVPGGSEWLARPGRLVVTGTLHAGDAVVATHDDLTSIAQSIFVAKIDSVARDGADGDSWIDRDGGTIVETLDLFDLAPSPPDTELRAESTLMALAPDGTATATDASGSTTFTAPELDASGDPTVEIPYSSTDLPDDAGIGVVFTTLVDVATGLVIAEHHDPLDVGQQVRWGPEEVRAPAARPPTAPTRPAPAAPPVRVDDLPHTGDDSTMRLLGPAVAFALVGSSLLVVSRIRRRRSISP